MADIQSSWAEFVANFTGVLQTVRIVDVIDIVVVAYILYQAILMVRETRAMQLLKGIVAILAVYLIAYLTRMSTLTYIIRYIVQMGVFALVVVFQPELRRALEQMGRTRFSLFGRFTSPEEYEQQHLQEMIDVVGKSCDYLSEKRIGALIVIERDTRLGEIIKTGTVIDAAPSLEMVANVFFPNSPLHDGAMIIREGRLYAAGCFLPLSSNMEISRDLGTRHRAALGMSEVSDALVVVVSEETGAVSVAADSRLQRKLSSQNLSKLLSAKLLANKSTEDSPQKKRFWRVKE